MLDEILLLFEAVFLEVPKNKWGAAIVGCIQVVVLLVLLIAFIMWVYKKLTGP